MFLVVQTTLDVALVDDAYAGDKPGGGYFVAVNVSFDGNSMMLDHYCEYHHYKKQLGDT